MTTMMRSIQADAFGPPSVMKIREVPVPEPGTGQARIQVAYVGMNPIDAMARGGKIDFLPIKFPFTPGLEHTGIVDKIGPGVAKKWLGTSVISRNDFGAYADFSIAMANNLLCLDRRIDLKIGAVYRGCSFTAWHALYKAGRLQSGETCLIHSAAGAIGIMATQIAKSAGCKVVGLAGNTDKIAYAEQFGADHLFDYTTEGWEEKVKTALGGRGINLILDGNGGPNSEKNIDLLGLNGRLVYIGATAGDYPQPIQVPLLIFKNVSVAGMNLASIEDPPDSETDRLIIDSTVTGAWKIPITQEVELEDVVDLHIRLEERQTMGRAVIRVGGDLFRETHDS